MKTLVLIQSGFELSDELRASLTKDGGEITEFRLEPGLNIGMSFDEFDRVVTVGDNVTVKTIDATTGEWMEEFFPYLIQKLAENMGFDLSCEEDDDDEDYDDEEEDDSEDDFSSWLDSALGSVTTSLSGSMGFELYLATTFMRGMLSSAMVRCTNKKCPSCRASKLMLDYEQAARTALTKDPSLLDEESFYYTEDGKILVAAAKIFSAGIKELDLSEDFLSAMLVNIPKEVQRQLRAIKEPDKCRFTILTDRESCSACEDTTCPKHPEYNYDAESRKRDFAKANLLVNSSSPGDFCKLWTAAGVCPDPCKDCGMYRSVRNFITRLLEFRDELPRSEYDCAPEIWRSYDELVRIYFSEWLHNGVPVGFARALRKVALREAHSKVAEKYKQ